MGPNLTFCLPAYCTPLHITCLSFQSSGPGTLALLPASHAALGKVLNFPRPLFLHLWNGYNSIFLTAIMWGLKEIKHDNLLSEHLVHGDYSSKSMIFIVILFRTSLKNKEKQFGDNSTDMVCRHYCWHRNGSLMFSIMVISYQLSWI